MARMLPKPDEQLSPIVGDLQALGQLVRNRRAHSLLRIDDAAAGFVVSQAERLIRIAPQVPKVDPESL